MATPEERVWEILEKGDEAHSKFYFKCKNDKLNDQQILFCLLYNIIDTPTFRNIKQSYMSAYDKTEETYLGPSGTKMMQKPKIKKAIKLAEKVLNQQYYDKIMLSKYHLDDYLEAKSDGRHQHAIKLLEMMGKSVGMYTDKQETVNTEKVDVAKQALSVKDKNHIVFKKKDEVKAE